MRILVMNVNTSPTMTDVIGAAARQHASVGTETVALRPYFGAEAVDCKVESYLSAVAVMDRVLAYDEPYDAVVLAGFGEHGRDGIQELIEQPVVEICEASAHVAMLIGRSYSVVTTSHATAGGTVAAGGPGGPVRVGPGQRDEHAPGGPRPGGRDAGHRGQARTAVQTDHAEVICLGCAGMAGLEEAITTELQVPVIDGVGAAVRLAEALGGLGLRTSKISTYAPPDPKDITGWPLSAALGLRGGTGPGYGTVPGR
jgi:allantoin racemase